MIDEEVREAVSELIEYTAVLFECNMPVKSIEPSQFQQQEVELYFVTLNADGLECEQAFDVLNHRGRNRGLYFTMAKENDGEAENPARTNLGLIHEIDPEIEQ